MDYSNKGVKTLFHGNNGSRVIPMKEWVEASKYKLVTDGSSSTEYMSGWHVFENFDELKRKGLYSVLIRLRKEKESR